MVLSASAILGWLNPKNIAYLVGSLVVAGGLWWAYSTSSENADLRQQVLANEVTIGSLEGQLDAAALARDAALAAQKRATEQLIDQERLRAEFDSTRRAIVRAAPENDAPVAPVLDDALDAIRERDLRDGTND